MACSPALPPVTPTGEPPVPTSAPGSRGPDEPPETYPLQSVSMTLERTVCYGTCPSYTVTVRGDGSVNYQGERFVAVEGARHRQIAQSAVIELLQQYYVLDFFSLRSAYVEGRDITVQTDGTVHETRAYVTDLPTVFVTLQLGSYTKRVQAYFQAPDAIYTLAKAIDDTAGTAEWVKQP